MDEAIPWIIGGILVIILLIASGGSFFIFNTGGNKPIFKDAYVDPTYLIPTATDSARAIIIYEIKNPTLLDFSGNVEFSYDKDCLNIHTTEQQVDVKSKSNQAFNKDVQTVNTNRYSDFPEKCYQTQSIFLKLSDFENTVVYDTKEIKVTIARS